MGMCKRLVSRRLLFYAALTMLMPTVVLAENLLRGPYLQQGDSDSIIVKWRSDVATDSQVEFGPSQTNLFNSAVNSTVTTEHEVLITGLTPSTRYYYNIGNTSGVLAGGDAEHFFETSPAPGTASSTRVWVIGDSGTTNSNAAAVYNAYLNYTGSTYTNLWLMLGDNAYNTGTDSEYQTAVFNMYPRLLKQTPLWSTLGNHDGYSADSSTQTGPYYDIFSFPVNAEVGGVASGTEAYYSYDHGNIHFIVLDSYETSRSTSGAMMSWLQTDLQNVTSDWIVAFWHHPPYSKGSHNSDTEGVLIDMRKNFLPVLEHYGVDLVLSGHSHSYERSKFIDGHYGSSSTFNSSHEIDGGSGRTDETGAYVKDGNQPNSGAVYAVAGASGKTSGGNLNHPAMYISLNQLGSMVLDINGSTMDVKYINNTGVISDYFSITKDTTPPTPPASPSNLTATTNSSNTITLNWTDNAENENGFDIERSLDSSSWNLAGTVGINTSNFNDTGLTPNTTYYYRVRAKNNGGNSNYSNITNATTDQGSSIETMTLQNGLNGFNGMEDSYVASDATSSNWGNSSSLNADGYDGANGELVGLVQWDVSSIPVTANVTEVNVTLEVFNVSSGSYNLYAMNNSWNEASVTWSNADINGNQGVQVATLFPNPTGSYTLTLNAVGVSLVQGWIDGSVINNGLMIRSTGTTNGVDIRSSEYSTSSLRPALTVTYETDAPQTLPFNPSNLSATATSFDTIDLSWNDNSDNETGFDIEHSIDNDSWSLIASVSSNITSFTDSGLTTFTTYYYRVNAKNSVGNSGFSNVASDATLESSNPVTIDFRNGLNGYTGTEDSYIASGKTANNYGNSTILEADGSDRNNGELVTLIRWDISTIPIGSIITEASATIQINNRSKGTYGFYAMNGSWSEANVTWSNANINSNQGLEIATINPNPTGSYTLTLNAIGIALIQSWVDGTTTNNGLVIRTTGTNDGMIGRSSEYGKTSQRPTLSITHQ